MKRYGQLAVGRVGPFGRVWADAYKSKRKRFCAWFERGRDIEVKYFPTRHAAEQWLRERTAVSIRRAAAMIAPRQH